jgi:hypothetical protein
MKRIGDDPARDQKGVGDQLQRPAVDDALLGFELPG